VGHGLVGWTYALVLGFALVYLGEHYVTDLLAGLVLAVSVKAVEPSLRGPVARLRSALVCLDESVKGQAHPGL
jgi:hypothetical protein